MPVFIINIWTFLVAFGPMVLSIALAAWKVVEGVYEVAKIAVFLALIGTAIELIFDKKGRARIGNLVYNRVAGALNEASQILVDVSPLLKGIVDGFESAVAANAPTLGKTFGDSGAKLAQDAFTTMVNKLTGAVSYLPEDAPIMVADALGAAFGLGASSAAVTAAFEAAFPERLNTIQIAGPILASMAGFEELAANIRDPLYKNAFGKNLEYLYRSTFKPEFADEEDAVKWHSRRLMSDADLREVFKYSGLKAKYEEAYVASAYRPVPPFLLARAAEAGALPQDQLTETLQFAGFRDIDISRLEVAYAALALQPYERTYLSTAERAVELGYETPLYLQNVMNTLNLNAEMQNLVQLTVAERRADNLTVLYKKSVSEAYKYGQVSDANYVSSLEAIGIDSAEANALYAVDSIAKSGKAAIAEQRYETRLAAQRTRAAMQASIAEYRVGQIDEIALQAALIAAGVDPQIASFAVVVQEARKSGPKVFVYGQELSRGAALQLREKVAALAVQSKAQLITYAEALNQLAALGVPLANAQALTAAWFATTTTPARVGIREPI